MPMPYFSNFQRKLLDVHSVQVGLQKRFLICKLQARIETGCAAIVFAFAFAKGSSLCLCRSRNWMCPLGCPCGPFRTQQWFDGYNMRISAQHDFCPQSCVVEKSASIHLDVWFKVLGKQCHPGVLVQRQLCSSVVASVAMSADPLLELFNVVSHVLDSALA